MYYMLLFNALVVLESFKRFIKETISTSCAIPVIYLLTIYHWRAFRKIVYTYPFTKIKMQLSINTKLSDRNLIYMDLMFTEAIVNTRPLVFCFPLKLSPLLHQLQPMLLSLRQRHRQAGLSSNHSHQLRR